MLEQQSDVVMPPFSAWLSKYSAYICFVAQRMQDKVVSVHGMLAVPSYQQLRCVFCCAMCTLPCHGQYADYG